MEIEVLNLSTWTNFFLGALFGIKYLPTTKNPCSVHHTPVQLLVTNYKYRLAPQTQQP